MEDCDTKGLLMRALIVDYERQISNMMRQSKLGIGRYVNNVICRLLLVTPMNMLLHETV